MGTMLQVMNVLVDICLLRRGPQHLPPSRVLTVLLLACYGALIAFAESAFGAPERAWTWTVTALLLLTTSVYLLLLLRGVPERWLQTLAAIAGCGCLYLALYLPVTASIDVAPGQEAGPFASLLIFAWIGLFFWGFMIEGGIYRHALGLSLPAGVLVSALMYAVAAVLYRGLFGGAA